MGTTSEKLTYLNNTKQLLKDKINNLGGDITDQTTFRQYANQLQGVYDNLPKTEYQEGTEITLSNTLKGKLDFDNGVVGIGQSSQDSTQGYNLLNLKDYTETINGVTITIRNGVITLNGTSTNYTARLISQEPTSQLNGDYNLNYEYVSGSVNGTSNINLYDGTTELATLYVNAISRNQNISFSNKVVSTRLYYHNNAVFNNFTIKPMLYSGNYDSSKTFEEYTGGQASPNPSYPQEIKYVRGKNLFETKQLTEETKNGITFTPVYENGLLKYINVNGTATAVASYWLQDGNTEQASTYPNKLSAGTYRLSDFYESSSYYRAIYFRYTTDNSTFTTINSYATPNITFSEDVKWMAFIRIASGETLNNAKFYPQLEKGTTSTPYLPYNTIEEVERGINFLDESTLSQGAWHSNPESKRCFFYSNYYLSAGTYTLITSLDMSQYMYGVDVATNKFPLNLSTQSIDIYDSGWQTGSYKTFTITQSGYLGVGVKKSNEGTITPSDISSYNFMIYEGEYDSSISYEPYITPKSYQLSLGDIELNAIGNYKDELVYDVDEDKVYKNEKIGKLVLNGSENYTESSSQPTSNLKFYLLQNIPDAKYFDGNSYVVGSALNNYLKDFDQNEYTSGTKEGFLIAQNGINFCISNMTLQEFKTKLQQNNMEICYIINATKKIPITDTTLVNQVKALYNAHSFTGTTIITSNGNLPMIIKCRGLKGE